MQYFATLAVIGVLVTGSFVTSVARGDTGIVLLASKKKAKKKRKSTDSSFGMDNIEAIEDNDSGVGIHREQEGVDTPYISEVGGATEISLLKSKSDDEPTQNDSIVSEGHICFRFGKFFLGPELGLVYTKSSSKVPNLLLGDSGTTVTKSVAARLGPLLKFFFVNVDRALTLPFIYAGAAYLTQTTTTESPNVDSTKKSRSGYEWKFGAGLTLMMDSNIGLAPRAEYYSRSLKSSGENATDKTTTSGGRILLELMTFL